MKKLSLVLSFLAVFVISTFAQLPTEIKGGILNGKATSLPKPEYPDAARQAGSEGVVYVNIVIDEEGNVVSAIADDQVRKVYKADKEGERVEQEQPVADALLRDAAEKAAWNAKFSPTRLSGTPVRVSGTIVYNFVSSSNSPPDHAGTVPAPTRDELARETEHDLTARANLANGGVLNGKAISLPAPEYPAAARAVKAQGAVSVKVTVDEGGNVIAATAVSGHPLLRAAALKAAGLAKFSPTMLSGEPVKITGVLVYNFVTGANEEN